MKILKPGYARLLTVLAVLTLGAIAAQAAEDTFVIAIGAKGELLEGGGTGYSSGQWYLQPSGCQWNSSDPHKMHFPQLPDLQGWDVDVTAANMVADDWKCSETGPVTDIHFWYSWQGDKVGIIDRIHASIYSNVPATDSTMGYSIPGKLLWERVFSPQEFNLRHWATGNQGFIMANAARPNDHKNIYQCSICNITNPFTQQAGQIYWLVLSITIRDPLGTHIGWKTSLDHFEDDAVYDAGGRWVELRDPQTQKSLDLAFVITGRVVPIPGIKWAQRPEIALCNVLPGCFFGWDELSVYAADDWLCYMLSDKVVHCIRGQIVADDWLCNDKRPITDIHWWGSFKGWASEQAPPQMPDGFYIAIWTDMPASASAAAPGFSHPGKVIWQSYCKNYTYKFVGWDVDPHDMAPPWEATFYFEYDLPETEWFWQDPSAKIYWISIAADYAKPTETRYPWGWKTRRRDPTSTAPDDAVIIFKPTNPAVGDTFQEGKPIYWPTPNRSWDMAFVLTTAEEVPECDWNPSDPHKMHHPQLPDLSPMGMDVDMAIVGLADDFKCAASGPITDIHFWGSFANDKLPKAGPGSLTFQVSIYADVPAGQVKPWSMPGELLWSRRFAPGQYSIRKVYEGAEDWYDPATGLYRRADHKQAYQYNFCIKDTPFIQEKGKIYWLQVEDIPPADLDYTFGWKTTTRELRWNDDAVFGRPDLGWQPLTYPTGHEFKAETLDLAFVITGQVVPECDWNAGDPHKMHWPQEPDLSDKGVDVDMFLAVLADDFKCTAAGPIKDIHFWGSFADDILPAGGPGSLAFKIAIHADIPATTLAPALVPGEPLPQVAGLTPAPGRGWSMPGEPLWTRTFQPGEYTVRQVHEGPEDWYDPATKLYQPNNHKKAYQYNFCIEVDPFVQQEGKTYWLAIKDIAPANAGYSFGWKTTTRKLRWNDDAVYLYSAGLGWLPMTYPDGHAYKGETLDLAFVITGGEEARAEHDLGDAPDSTNTFAVPMTAYPKGGPLGVKANYPTVFGVGSPPHGPIHLQPRAVAYLGSAVSLENEADVGPDEDGINNIVPPNDSPDLDKADDGVQVPLVLPHCQQTRFKYKVTVVPLATIEPPPLYVNVWFDWNRDGDWNDVLDCPDGTKVAEWAVQNQLLQFVTSGTYDVTTPAFTCWHPPGATAQHPIWMRITLSEQQWGMVLSAARVGGDGPAAGYQFGETEDYYFVPEAPPAPQYDFGDAPDPKYPTLLASNGARHLIGGPWFDIAGKPDAEPDGQPDPRALGDDNNGNDDEDGVHIPPLIQGHNASIIMHVNGGGGNVRGWIDFDGDGIWQIDERIYNGVLPNGRHIINILVPADAAIDGTFARFRISSASGLGPAGEAPDGEVEDYRVEIKAPPPDIEWPQWPDLTENGINIRVDTSDGKLRMLADDFKCTSYKKLTDVHLWGSWKNDRKGVIKRIHLSVHADDPAGPGGSDPQNRFSQPDREVLWAKDFGPGQFTETLYYAVPEPGEWWWDLVSGELTKGGDKEVWQIDIYINSAEAFQQKGSPDNPIIYWLDVQIDTEKGQFGWKTRQWPEHYMDDAVWDVGSELPRLWKELRYPPGHPYHGLEKDSIDMAFLITGREEAPPPPPVPEHLKWSQPPIEIDPRAKTPFYCGWDELSFAIRPSTPVAVLPTVWNIVADDFRCLGSMPITSVHWWGSYKGWDGVSSPAVRPTAFSIGFWSNVPANRLAPALVPGEPLPQVAGLTPGHSFPRKLLWRVDVPAERVQEERAGLDRFPQVPADTCFRYYVKFEPHEYFWQHKYIDSATGDDIFWISITAVYPPITIPFQQWGWKTRPSHWMDDAVKFTVQGELPLGYANDPPLIFTLLEAALCGQRTSFDMAFELDTDPSYIKWEQAFTGIRQWRHYADEESLALTVTFQDQKEQLHIRRLVADDWPCEQITPITAAVWWGSYIGYRYQPCDCPQVAPPLAPDYFLLSIWTDVRPAANAPLSRPGEKIWEYKAENYDEVLVGYDKKPETVEPGLSAGYEPVFRYSVRLPQDKWFCQKELNNIYWFSVVAVYKGDKQPLHPWGWTNHRYVHWELRDPTSPANIAKNDDAVAGYLDTTGATPMWKWQELRDQTGESADMSFILFTEPGCLPCTYSAYGDWLALGKPDCWCAAYQCDGDADGGTQTVFKYRVYGNDLDLIKQNWKKLITDPTLNPCADIDHKAETVFKYRVYGKDLSIILTNWKKTDAALPGNCPRPE